MYDNICKFLAEKFPTNFATWLLGQPIELTELSPKELSLEPIRADSIILLQSDDLVLHIEFQTDPDPKIPFRMTDYRLRGYRRFPHKRMLQFVVYLQQIDSELVRQDTFTLERTFHSFQVIRMWEQPTDVFLQTPGLLPFAVLSNTDNQARTLQAVAAQIETITDRNAQSNVTASAAILAGLVLKEEVIKRLLRRDIMRESVIYKSIIAEGLEEGREQGREQGREEGREEGREQGREEGREEEVKRIAVNLLKEGLSFEVIAKATGLTVERVEQLQQEITQAENQEE